MFNNKLADCPTCGDPMERGFSSRSSSLSLILSKNMRKFIFKDYDLNQAGLKTLLPALATYNRSYHCPKCRIYIVDYGQPLSSAEAKELAES